jgi:endo-cleaving rubber dioxygenase
MKRVMWRRNKVAGTSVSRRCAALLSALLLAACAGEYDGGEPGPSTGGGGGGGIAASARELFDTRIQPRMDFCRTCHVPGGVGDVEDGRDFMLGEPAQDYDNLYASWQTLGQNNPVSRLLLMPSGQEPHSGGTPWPQGSDAYKDMDALLKCWGEPDRCSEFLAGTGGGPATEEFPLLGSKRGGHLWFDFCEGKDDSVALPVDPRALVQPGISDGKAVHFNAYWKDCHADPQLVGERPHPQTCGELRASWEKGRVLMEGHGEQGAGNFFAGADTVGQFSISADQYNGLWRFWGLSERPDNFDELMAERYGLPKTQRRNPYPLPGEDPNATDGGSGQLSAFMTQIRTPEGGWTGEIGLTCHGCHSSHIGDPADGSGPGLLYGLGNALADTGVTGRDLGLAGYSPIAVFSLFGASRGTNNASDVNVFFLTSQDNGVRLDAYTLGVLLSGMTGSGDTPQWWNLGSRPLKFQDGFFAADASRVDLIFYNPLGRDDADAWMREHAPAANDWILSLKAPEYPLEIDTALAEQGAILFHSKDLWAEGLDNPAPRPDGGNGSCASCHGAYSPRYVNDPAYLADPSLEGVASYIVPKSVIRTDSARVDTNNEAVNQYGSTSFLGYSETVGTEQDCGPQQRAEIRGEREFGYLAPPLYGVWASAPYLHNGSIPDLWSLLKPDERPALWRRVSTPARADQQGQVVMGFDTHMQRAYDPERGGWRYETLACGTGTLPFIDCDPLGGDGDPLVQQLLAVLYGNVLVAWNVGNLPVLTQWTPQQIENRKIYNTHLFSQGNEGHDFTAVLTDAERRALIEYMKTL